MNIMTNKSLVKEYYSGKCIFITGATGFVGKVLLEKLLRYCDGIEKIYILIRSKKGQTVDQRWKTLLKSKLFGFELDINKIEQKVTPIEGDLSMPGMGLKESDESLLINNVSIIFHVAGDVKFNETLRDAVTHNLIGTKFVMNLCKKMNKLDVLVHTSTAYAFCQRNDCEEKIYPMKVTPEEVIHAVNTLDDNQLENFMNPLMEGRPNPYTFAKALAEHIVFRERGEIPTAIVRPSIILSSYEEPVPGWIDNFNGGTGIALLGCLGIMRIADYDANKKLSLVPVDLCGNALIASAWHLGTNKPKDIQIYNIASEPHNTPPLVELVQYMSNESNSCPSMKLVRPIAGIPLSRPSKIRVFLTMLISHTLFAYFLDSVIFVLGHKPIMVSVTNRMHNGFEMLSYFWMRQWTFHSENARNLMKILKTQSPNDVKELKFDVSEIDWRIMSKNSWIGGRRYLLKENDDSIPQAKKRLQKMIYGYRMFLLFWYSLLAYALFFLISKLFSLYVV